MHHSEMKSDVRRLIAEGTVLPAHPLALDASRALDTVHQRALTRYYIDAGTGGLAVRGLTTALWRRGVGLFETGLGLKAEKRGPPDTTAPGPGGGHVRCATHSESPDQT